MTDQVAISFAQQLWEIRAPLEIRRGQGPWGRADRAIEDLIYKGPNRAEDLLHRRVYVAEYPPPHNYPYEIVPALEVRFQLWKKKYD